MSLPTDPFELFRYHMIRAHDTFKLGHDIILKQLSAPPMDDIKNFMGYCKAWAVSIAGHHDSEEDCVFPMLNKKMDFTGEAEQHKVIHDGLDKIIAMVGEVQADPSKFDIKRAKELFGNLKDPLFTHLDDEVKHIAPAKIKAAGVTETEMVKMINEMEKHAKGQGDPYLKVPYMCSHIPPEYKAVWPGLHWFLRKFVVPYGVAMRYSGYWKYSPYSMS
ncbi:hypothetical protein DFH11DRAFT_1565247 [Phellopilus nigrolimitatus]|nr:hypothetical protein DFH11DRAFT_1565247 [Phellopilus nigrolimitatus]